MNCSCRTNPLFFLFLAVGLTAWGVIAYFDKPAEPVGFTIENPERDLGPQPVGETLLTFPIANGSTEARRIIGLAEG